MKTVNETKQLSFFNFEINTFLDIGSNSWLRLIPNIVQLSAIEFSALWQMKPKEQDRIILFGKKHKIPRYQRFYADKLAYSYSGKTMIGYPIENQTLLRALAYVNRLEPNLEYNGILLNWYETGKHSMGAHADDEKELISLASIYSISFGGSRIFRIRSKKSNNKPAKKWDISLGNGDLLIMGGETQLHFKHEIIKTVKLVEPRINLTIRAFNKLAQRPM